jgi:hypothetical protein
LPTLAPPPTLVVARVAGGFVPASSAWAAERFARAEGMMMMFLRVQAMNFFMKQTLS